VVKLCCWEDLASFHGKGCIPTVPFANIPMVHKQVQTMDGSKLRSWTLFCSFSHVLPRRACYWPAERFLFVHDILITCAEESRDPEYLLG
jgi:hypothetical protein